MSKAIEEVIREYLADGGDEEVAEAARTDLKTMLATCHAILKADPDKLQSGSPLSEQSLREAVKLAGDAIKENGDKMIENFLTHHKRLCPANRGRNCTCGLFKAREEIRLIRGYLKYVEGKVEFNEVPMTFEQWQVVEQELA